jgi:hypothetical protein
MGLNPDIEVLEKKEKYLPFWESNGTPGFPSSCPFIIFHKLQSLFIFAAVITILCV